MDNAESKLEAVRLNASPTRRRWFRFSLRTFLIAITIFGIWLGFQVSAARTQRAAVTAIRQAGGVVQFDYQRIPGKTADPDDYGINTKLPVPGPEWLRNRIGDDYFRTPIIVAFDERQVTSEVFSQIASFSELNSLNVSALNADSLHLNDSDLIAFKNLRELRAVRLDHVTIDGFGLRFLANANHLRWLYISSAPITDAGMEQISKLETLETLDVIDARITDAGLRHLQSLRKLNNLVLSRNDITDAGLQYLKGLKSLKMLILYETEVTKGGIDDLQQSLPNTEIRWPAMPLRRTKAR
jgi:hypothetical protein